MDDAQLRMRQRQAIHRVVESANVFIYLQIFASACIWLPFLIEGHTG
jgi:hypothetical protein